MNHRSLQGCWWFFLFAWCKAGLWFAFCAGVGAWLNLSQIVVVIVIRAMGVCCLSWHAQAGIGACPVEHSCTPLTSSGHVFFDWVDFL